VLQFSSDGGVSAAMLTSIQLEIHRFTSLIHFFRPTEMAKKSLSF
jgi:hypothetical protein